MSRHRCMITDLAFVCRSAFAVVTLATAATAAAPSRPSAGSRPAAHAATAHAAQPSAQRVHHRQPRGAELIQFHNEMERAGWQGAVPALIPTSYVQENGAVKTAEPHFATFFGDVDGDGKPEWVIGYYVQSHVSPSEGRISAMGQHDDRARVAIFKGEGERWRLHWVSPGLGFQFKEPEFNMRDVERGFDRMENLLPPLALLDVDGDHHLDIVYNCWSESAALGGLPGIYHYDGKRWVSVAPQAERFSIRDLKRDGKKQVVAASRYVGYGSGDDDVPRVWRWNGRQFEEASSQFPGFYKELAKQYQDFVKRAQANGGQINKSVWDRAIQKATSLGG